MQFSDLPKHHAILLTHADRQVYADGLWKHITSSSPAHRYFNQTVLDIDTARDMISFAQSPYSGEKIALVSFNTASVPAQNALLKVLEEPRSGVRFILVTANKSHLIDTVLSRVRHVSVASEQSEEDARLFLSTPSASRMKLPNILSLLAKTDEEGRKNREATKSFILSVVSALSSLDAEPRFVLETMEVASYASDPSSSGKALLEYLSLLLPVIK